MFTLFTMTFCLIVCFFSKKSWSTVKTTFQESCKTAVEGRWNNPGYPAIVALHTYIRFMYAVSLWQCIHSFLLSNTLRYGFKPHISIKKEQKKPEG